MIVNVKSDCRGWDVQDVISQIFIDRGIEDPEHFLHPKISDMLPLDAMENSVEAAKKVNNAVGNGYRIGILADTDLDGISSGAIMYRYLKKMGAEDVDIYINHGKQHGLQKDNIIQYKNCDLFIIVDSLDPNCYNYTDLKNDSQIEDIIVLDHHGINKKIPYDKYITLVSSQRNYNNPDLSGAGVTWKFCLLLDEINKTNYADDLVDLAGSGLCADMMDMTIPENRYIMDQALKSVYNPAIKKIVGGFGWDSKAIAFSLAPLCNASNRLDKNKDALMAFLVDDNKEVLKYVKTMKSCKDEQNEEIEKMMDSIEEQCVSQLDKKMIIIEIDTEFGIAGLIGNRLLDKYKRPLLIVKDYGDYYQGSMRAIGVKDFRAMLNDSGVAKSFGHELAASVEFLKSDRQFLIDYMETYLPEVGSFKESYDADIHVDIDDIDRVYINKIKELNRISGTGFKPIKVYIDGIYNYDITDMSNGKHLVIHPDNSELNLIQWNFNGNWEVLEDASLMGDELEIVGELQSGWLGKNFMLQCIIDYVGVKDE